MSQSVFIVSEWLPKEGCDEKLWIVLKELMAITKQREKGCIRAHATRQVSHPGSPGVSNYTIVCLQEYSDLASFDLHCQSEYVKSAFKTHVEDEKSALVQEWCCRLFSEDD